MTALYGRTSADTAYVVNGYPYGRLRCTIKFWLEEHPKKGFRFCSQTQNPKTGVWNAVKKSTYVSFAAQMFLDEKGHCTWTGIGEYSRTEDVLSFFQRFPDASRISDLKLYAKHAAKRARQFASGEAFFTINGGRQENTETDKQRYLKDAEAWERVFEILDRKR